MTAPADYKTAGTMMIVSGATNLLASFALIGVLIWFCVGGFWFVTLALAVFELVVGVGVSSGQPKGNAKTAAIIGIVNSVLCGNVIGLILQIIALTKLGTPESVAYLEDHGM
jgi:hypothetical protein